jgi:hypothetical protein
MREINNPFEVDLISSNDDALGVMVPMPAAPVEGNVFVCATATNENKVNTKAEQSSCVGFIKYFSSKLL